MLAIIHEIGVIQSVIIAACLCFMLGMLVVIVGERIYDAKKEQNEKIDIVRQFQKWPKFHEPT